MKFGKLMSIPDKLLEPYYRAFTPVTWSEFPVLRRFISEQPMEAKKQLAALLVAAGSGRLEDGLLERERFELKFSKRQVNEKEMPVFEAPTG